MPTFCGLDMGHHQLQVSSNTHRAHWDGSGSLCTGVRCVLRHNPSFTAFYSDNTLISGSADHCIKIWNLDTCEVMSTLVAHDNPVCTLTLKGDRLFSGSLKSIKVRLIGGKVQKGDHVAMVTMGSGDHGIR